MKRPRADFSRLRKQPDRLASIRELTELAKAGEDHRDWYRTARAQVYAASVCLDVSAERFADLLSLYSPRVSVVRSVRLTLHYLKTGEHRPDTLPNVQKAVEHYEQTGEIRGPKTSEFARALCGDDDAIVLDVWMAHAFNVPQTRFNDAPSIRRYCSECVAYVAHRLGWTNAETQAAIWAGAVRSAGRNVPLFLIMPEIDGIPI